MGSILFILTLIALCFLAFMILNNYIKNALYLIVISFSSYLSYISIISIIYSLFNLPISFVSVSACNILLGLILCFFIFKRKMTVRANKITIDIIDVYVILMNLGIGIFVFLSIYSKKINLKFLTTDPTVHFLFSKYFSETKRLLLTYNELIPYEHMSSYPFLTYANLGLWMQLTDSNEIKLIVYFTSNFIFYLFISFAVYCIYKKVVNKVDFLQATILIIATAFGYNLNSILFGFSSQMTGIFIALTLILLCDLQWSPRVRVSLITVNLIGLFFAYYYFIPAAMLGLLISNGIKSKGSSNLIGLFKKLFSIQNVIIAAITVFFGILYLIILNHTVENGDIGSIKFEGYIYRDLYSNFKPYLLFTIIAFYYWIRNKELTLNNFTLFFSFVVYCLFTLVVFILGMNGNASSYYYFKNYYLLENLLVILFCIGLFYVKSQSKQVYFSFLIVFLLLGCMTLLIDKPVREKNELFNPEIEENLTKIQTFNKEISKNMQVTLTKSQREFMDYIDQNKSEFVGNKGYLPVIGDLLQQLWFYSYTEIWPKYNNNALAAVYEERILDYEKWSKDPDRNQYLVLFNDYEEWMQKENVEINDFEIIYQTDGAMLVRSK